MRPAQADWHAVQPPLVVGNAKLHWASQKDW